MTASPQSPQRDPLGRAAGHGSVEHQLGLELQPGWRPHTGAVRGAPVLLLLILRYTGMRRESVATLRVRNIDAGWGLRNVSVKGGTTRDIPLPAAVTQFLQAYVDRVVAPAVDALTHDTPLFWSEWGRRQQARRGRRWKARTSGACARPTAG